jgi:hypothetical protein
LETLGFGDQEEIVNQDRRRWSGQDMAMEAPARAGPETQALPTRLKRSLHPPQSNAHRPSISSAAALVQARKILTQHIFGMVDRGERDEQRLTLGGLAHLKAVEREHGIKSANGAGV